MDVIRRGFFRISYNNQKVRRYFCKCCSKSFSARRFKETYRQKKPYLNSVIESLLCHGMTMRGIAKHLKISKTTVDRKFLWLSNHLPQALKLNLECCNVIQLDELETIEHTKCKPLSVLVCVSQEGFPLAFKVARMPAKGLLAEFSRKRYGKRSDERDKVLERTLRELHYPEVVKTDGKPSYATLIKRQWPDAKHLVFTRAKKQKLQDRLHETQTKRKFDPLFSLNHLCASLRADIRRLTRRSWCTTKKPENLQRHLNIYLNFRTLFHTHAF
jgi:hypothetical protein